MSRNGSTAWNAKCDYAGLVFGYVDKDNFWVRLFDDANDQVRVYQVSSGAWTQKNSASFTITTGSAFSMTAEVRAGAAHDYAGTVPAGQIGILSSEGTDNSFDDFKVQDIAGPFEADGLYFSNRGQVRTDNSDNNVIEAYATDGLEECIVRRGFRGDTYVATFKFKWNDDSHPGWLVRWLSPGDYLALAISSADDKTRLCKRESDGTLTTLATAANGLGLSSGTWYEAKVVIDDDPNDASLQQLRFWVDTDGDSDYSDETAQITTTAVDDVWSAGYAGLYRAAGGSSAQEFDDVKIFIDNDEDSILDAADDIQIDDDFSSNVMSLSYDNNGNLTDDAVYKYEYDAWNRLVEAKRRVDAETSVATYAYLGDNRRAKKVVQNSGVEETANDGGNTTVHFYYGLGGPSLQGWGTRMSGAWNIYETRNGSSQATAQYFWGTQYTDEIVFADVNGDPTRDNDCSIDNSTAAETTPTGENPPDARYFYHQDRNWNVVALSEYDTRGTKNGRIVERYGYTPYGQFVVLTGDSGSGELGNVSPTSTVGNVFAQQGLPIDHEKTSYQNRFREYVPALHRFAQPDPSGYRDGAHRYLRLRSSPSVYVDVHGQASRQWWIIPFCCSCRIDWVDIECQEHWRKLDDTCVQYWTFCVCDDGRKGFQLWEACVWEVRSRCRDIFLFYCIKSDRPGCADVDCPGPYIIRGPWDPWETDYVPVSDPISECECPKVGPPREV